MHLTDTEAAYVETSLAEMKAEIQRLKAERLSLFLAMMECRYCEDDRAVAKTMKAMTSDAHDSWIGSVVVAEAALAEHDATHGKEPQ